MPPEAPPAALEAVARRMRVELPFTTGDVAFWLMLHGVPADRFRRRGPTFEAAAELVARERSAGRIRLHAGKWVPQPSPEPPPVGAGLVTALAISLPACLGLEAYWLHALWRLIHG